MTRSMVGAGIILTVFTFVAMAQERKPDRKQSMQAEIDRLKSPFATEIVLAARNLSNMGADAKTAVPAMAEALRKLPFPDDRVAVAKAIARMGPSGSEAIPTIAQTLSVATFPQERVALIKVLGEMGPVAKEAVPALTQSLKAITSDERKAAAEALGKIGPGAKEAVPALKDAANAGFHDVRGAARLALQRIQSTEGHVGIVDAARMFNTINLKIQQEEMTNLARRYELDLLVETVPIAPKATIINVGKLTKDEDPNYLAKWVQERITERQFDGVFILVTREPLNVHVETTLRGKLYLSEADAQRMAEDMRKFFQVRRNDDGLAAGLAVLRGSLTATAGRGLR